MFAEGDFTATYKFALLISLADLAVEFGADNGNALILTTRQIGERFISLYWKHSLPYGTGYAGSEAGILAQNNGTQAKVLSAISDFREADQVSYFAIARLHPDYRNLLGTVSTTVSAQPLTYLQNFGGDTDEFIFERAGVGDNSAKAGYHVLPTQVLSRWFSSCLGHIGLVTSKVTAGTSASWAS